MSSETLINPNNAMVHLADSAYAVILPNSVLQTVIDTCTVVVKNGEVLTPVDVELNVTYFVNSTYKG